jgi:hypothetical protein
MGEDLPVGERAVDRGAHRAEVTLSDRGADRAQASSRSGSAMPAALAATAISRRNSVPIWWPSPREPQWMLTTTWST